MSKLDGNRMAATGHEWGVDGQRDRDPDAPGLSDQDLWDRALLGDVQAFGDLFVRHQAVVHTFCFRRTSSWSVAEDLLSSVFLEVWRTRRPLDLQNCSLAPWLIGVATRLTWHYQRSAYRHKRMLDRFSGHRDFDGPGLDDGVAARIDDERQMAAVLVAVRRLSKVDQDVIAACIFAELSYADAASSLGVPVGTVKSRLSRARLRLNNEFSAPGAAESVRPKEILEPAPRKSPA